MSQEDKIRELLDTLEETRAEIVDAEIQLAKLHANIYKCREETRKIRFSFPSQEYLDKIRRNVSRMSKEEATRTLERLTQKRERIDTSLAKIRGKTFCHLQKTCPREPDNRNGTTNVMGCLVLTMLLVGCSFFIGKFLVRRPKEENH